MNILNQTLGIKLCYTNNDSFIIHIITEGFYKDISDDNKIWFDTFNYDENDKRPLPIGINKKVIGLFKDELGGKVMKEFVALRAKTYERWQWEKKIKEQIRP